MRWIALAERMGFDPNTIDMHLIVGAAVEIAKVTNRIRSEVASLGGVSLIVVDTSAAYFNCEECNDENNNVLAGNHARMFRSLTTLAGGPTVLVLAHPAKLAKDNSQLLPRGGGAFLAEVDGNLAARKLDALVELHWQGKFRGPEFDPLSFELSTVTAAKLKDSKGRLIHTVLAEPLSEEERAAVEAHQQDDDNSILVLMGTQPGLSLMDMAKLLQWKNSKGTPNKKRVQKVMERLRVSKLVTMDAGTKRFKLTNKGGETATAVVAKQELDRTVPQG
jgi:hypothetical protein